MFNMRLDYMLDAGGQYSAGDIIQVSMLPKEFQSPPNSRTARTQYVYIRDVPGIFSDYTMLAACKYHPATDPDDPHSGGVKHSRQYYFDVPGYAGLTQNQQLDPIEDQWDRVKGWLIDKETGAAIQFK